MSLKILNISSSVSIPRHLKKVVIGDLRFLSILTVIKFLLDVSISIHAPLYGMILASHSCLPDAGSALDWK